MKWSIHRRQRSYSLVATADEVRLMLYEAGEGGHAYETVKMQSGEEGTWTAVVSKDLIGKFYTFNVKIDDKWQGDTPGINARAVGVTGSGPLLSTGNPPIRTVGRVTPDLL